MMDNFLTILNEVWINGLLGVSMTKIIVSIAVLLLSFLLRGFVVNVVISSIEKLAKSTESKLDDEILKAVKKPLSYVPVTIGIYVVTMILPLEGVAGDISSNIVKALIIFTISFFSNIGFGILAKSENSFTRFSICFIWLFIIFKLSSKLDFSL